METLFQQRKLVNEKEWSSALSGKINRLFPRSPAGCQFPAGER
jgi:hypothetical protein